MPVAADQIHRHDHTEASQQPRTDNERDLGER